MCDSSYDCNNEDVEVHPCPYQQELFENDDDCCTCCAECARECNNEV